ncbi:MAG: class I SAM-dependent methyltransferase [Chloroflexales bacterium]|nr:class I SAM-dependent methyltransferase [Chloroflexales bacterium]
MKEISCNLCGSDERRLLCTGYDRSIPQNTRVYSLQQCTRCGLVYLSPRPDTPEELDEIYPPSYESYVGEGQRLLMLMRRAAWRPEINEILARTTPASKILEIGSATGEFLAELRRRGRSQLVGLELSAEAARIARERHGLDVRASALDDAELPAGSFDLVVLRHVLEHMPDPRATLGTIARLLRPGGHCIFTIPNIDSHTARIFGRDWYGYDVPRHFFLFPRRTLVTLLKVAGLRVEHIVYVAAPNVWIGSLRFWLAARGHAALARISRYQNPLAIAALAPLGIVSALLRSSGVIRVIVQRPA